MSVRFSIQPAHESGDGRKYPQRVMIHISTDGGIHEVVRPATEDDKRKHRAEYALVAPETKAAADNAAIARAQDAEDDATASRIGRMFGKRK